MYSFSLISMTAPPTSLFERRIASTTLSTGTISFFTLPIANSPPSTAYCSTGTWTWDANYVYVCVSSAAWKRSALTGGY